MRRKTNTIGCLRNIAGIWIEKDGIAQLAFDYYDGIFTSKGCRLEERLMGWIVGLQMLIKIVYSSLLMQSMGLGVVQSLIEAKISFYYGV